MQRRFAAIVACLAGAVLLLAVMMGGCGGHSAQAPQPGPPGVGTATFVGQAVCEGCHSDVAAEYATQAHGAVNWGGSFRNKRDPSNNVITGYGGACQPCHTVGYGERSGFQPDGSTPELEGIGCEECHGPGSNHAAAPSSASTNGHPSGKETCYDCHAQSYKLLDTVVPPVTDADLAGSAPGSVSVHHPQAAFLEGVRGFDIPTQPSPHTLVQDQCVGCHLNPQPSAFTLGDTVAHGDELDHGGDGLHPDTATCAPCHGGEAGAAALFEHFEEEIVDALIELAGEDPANPGHPNEDVDGGAIGAFAAAHSIDMGDNSNPDDPNAKKLKGAIYCVEYIMSDGSYGAHNPEFAEDLLEKARDLLGLP